jgi:hypothetical protein
LYQNISPFQGLRVWVFVNRGFRCAPPTVIHVSPFQGYARVSKLYSELSACAGIPLFRTGSEYFALSGLKGVGYSSTVGFAALHPRLLMLHPFRAMPAFLNYILNCLLVPGIPCSGWGQNISPFQGLRELGIRQPWVSLRSTNGYSCFALSGLCPRF